MAEFWPLLVIPVVLIVGIAIDSIIREKKLKNAFDSFARDFDLELVSREDIDVKSAVDAVSAISGEGDEVMHLKDVYAKSRDPENRFFLFSGTTRVRGSMGFSGSSSRSKSSSVENLVLFVPMRTDYKHMNHVWLKHGLFVMNYSPYKWMKRCNLPDPVPGFLDKFNASLNLLDQEIQKALLNNSHRYPFGKASFFTKVTGMCQDFYISHQGFMLRGILTSSPENVKNMLRVARDLKEAIKRSRS